MSDRVRRLAGAMAKSNGANFEAQIEQLCEVYKQHELLELNKRYEPYKRVGRGSGTSFKGVHIGKSGCDFELWLYNGKAGHLEAKSRESERITKDALDDTQQAQLQRRVRWGQLALVLVRLQGVWYLIDYKRWHEGDRMSHNHAQLAEIGTKLNIKNGIPDLLTPLLTWD